MQTKTGNSSMTPASVPASTFPHDGLQAGKGRKPFPFLLKLLLVMVFLPAIESKPERCVYVTYEHFIGVGSSMSQKAQDNHSQLPACNKWFGEFPKTAFFFFPLQSDIFGLEKTDNLHFQETPRRCSQSCPSGVFVEMKRKLVAQGPLCLIISASCFITVTVCVPR